MIRSHAIAGMKRAALLSRHGLAQKLCYKDQKRNKANMSTTTKLAATKLRRKLKHKVSNKIAAWRTKRIGTSNNRAHFRKGNNIDSFVCNLQETKSQSPTSGEHKGKGKRNSTPKESLFQPTWRKRNQSCDPLPPDQISTMAKNFLQWGQNGEFCHCTHTKTTCAAPETKNPAK